MYLGIVLSALTHLHCKFAGWFAGSGDDCDVEVVEVVEVVEGGGVVVLFSGEELRRGGVSRGGARNPTSCVLQACTVSFGNRAEIPKVSARRAICKLMGCTYNVDVTYRSGPAGARCLVPTEFH